MGGGVTPAPAPRESRGFPRGAAPVPGSPTETIAPSAAPCTTQGHGEGSTRRWFQAVGLPRPTNQWEPTWEVSLYSSARDARPSAVAWSWRALRERLREFRVARGVTDKRELPAWSPAQLLPGARRANDNVATVSCIVLDYDDGTSLDLALGPWLDWPCLWHTSWSHTEEVPRFRLVVPLERAVPARAWRWVWAWAAQRAAGNIDGACKDASRLYFLPAVKDADAPRWAGHHDPGGRLCDPDWHLASEEELARAGRAPEALARREEYQRTRPMVVGAAGAKAAAREALRHDPAARERAGLELGARITSEAARGIRCPGCGRDSVWFPIAPDGAGGARCNHANSCGWYGWIDELLRGGKV
jgi:hypothetical protein